MHFHQNMMHLDTGRIPKSIKMKLAYVDFQDILTAFLEPKSFFRQSILFSKDITTNLS